MSLPVFRATRISLTTSCVSAAGNAVTTEPSLQFDTLVTLPRGSNLVARLDAAGSPYIADFTIAGLWESAFRFEVAIRSCKQLWRKSVQEIKFESSNLSIATLTFLKNMRHDCLYNRLLSEKVLYWSKMWLLISSDKWKICNFLEIL